VRHAGAAAVWLAALGLTLALAPELQQERVSLVFFSLAVLFAAWYSGAAAGMAAAAAALAALDYFVTAPRYAIGPPTRATLLAFLVFSAASWLVGALTRAAEASRRAADEYARLLEGQATEREERAVAARRLADELARANEELDAATLHAEASRDSAQAERERLQTVFDSLPDATNVFDRSWRWTYLNPVAAQWVRNLGRDPEALVGKCVWDEFPVTRATRFYSESVRAADEGRRVEFEEQGLDGGWYESRVVPTADGVVSHSRDVTARRRAADRDRYLGEASRMLALSLDARSALGQLAQLAVPTLADWSTVELLDDRGALEQVAVAHADPDRAQWARELRRRFPQTPSAAGGVEAVVRSGRALFYPKVTDEMLAVSIADPEQLALLREAGVRSVIIAPLATGTVVLGALTLVCAGRRRAFVEADLAMAEEIGRRAALALENGRLYAPSGRRGGTRSRPRRARSGCRR
jgi:K+-sensing histidine kinase KdpD